MLSQRVIVYTGGIFGGIRIGVFHLGTGIIFIPFIVCLIWMFMTGSKWSKICFGLSVIIILVSVITSVDLHLVHTSLFEWIVILALIFGGAGVVIREYSRRD
jgi:hypothetical protein